MPRVSKIETCMFCDMVPCECNKPAPKERKARVVKMETKPEGVVATIEVTDRSLIDDIQPARRPGPFANFKSPTEQLREQAQTQPVSIEEPAEEWSGHMRRPSGLEVVLDSGIVHPEDERLLRRQHIHRDPPTDLAAKLHFWKKSRG